MEITQRPTALTREANSIGPRAIYTTRVRCGIYRERPAACHKVEAGSALCQSYRQGQGLRL